MTSPSVKNPKTLVICYLCITLNLSDRRTIPETLHMIRACWANRLVLGTQQEAGQSVSSHSNIGVSGRTVWFRSLKDKDS